MPYIEGNLRTAFDPWLDKLDGKIWSPGELNYVITRLIDDFLDSAPTYETYNAAVGVLACAQAELYRRRVVPYEDKKCLENGDVFRYTEDAKERDQS